MTDITIPPKALKAARLAYGDLSQDDPIEAALRAGIAAWPGMEIEVYQNGDEGVYLPLPTPPQEASDAEG